MPFDVFLCHNSSDKPIVRKIADALKARQLKVWLDEWELVPGRPWQEALESALKETVTAAVFVGADGRGPWQNLEIRALLAQFVGRDAPVIPVLLPSAQTVPVLPLFLTLFVWVDLRGGLTEDALDRLEWGITGHKPPSIGSPNEPVADSTSNAVASPERSNVERNRLIQQALMRRRKELLGY